MSPASLPSELRIAVVSTATAKKERGATRLLGAFGTVLVLVVNQQAPSRDNPRVLAMIAASGPALPSAVRVAYRRRCRGDREDRARRDATTW